jgi:hypothetical protein
MAKRSDSVGDFKECMLEVGYEDCFVRSLVTDGRFRVPFRPAFPTKPKLERNTKIACEIAVVLLRRRLLRDRALDVQNQRPAISPALPDMNIVGCACGIARTSDHRP